MRYDAHNTGSSGTLVSIVLVLVFLVLAGLFVLGFGGWYFLRNSHTQTERALVAERQAREMAEAAAETNRAQALKTAAEFEKEVVNTKKANREIVIELDKQGKLRIDGEPTDLGGLNGILEAALAKENVALTVDVLADEQCMFRHVEEVISLCRDWGVARFRIRSLDPLGAYNSPEDKEPATVIK